MIVRENLHKLRTRPIDVLPFERVLNEFPVISFSTPSTFLDTFFMNQTPILKGIHLF